MAQQPIARRAVRAKRADEASVRDKTHGSHPFDFDCAKPQKIETFQGWCYLCAGCLGRGLRNFEVARDIAGLLLQATSSAEEGFPDSVFAN